jgi:hypothetical protein
LADMPLVFQLGANGLPLNGSLDKCHQMFPWHSWRCHRNANELLYSKEPRNSPFKPSKETQPGGGLEWDGADAAQDPKAFRRRVGFPNSATQPGLAHRHLLLLKQHREERNEPE